MYILVLSRNGAYVYLYVFHMYESSATRSVTPLFVCTSLQHECV